MSKKIEAMLNKETKRFNRFVIAKGAVTGTIYISKKIDIPETVTISLNEGDFYEKQDKKSTKGKGRKEVVRKESSEDIASMISLAVSKAIKQALRK